MRLGDPSPTLRLLAALTDQRTRPRLAQTGETRGELDEFVVDTLPPELMPAFFEQTLARGISVIALYVRPAEALERARLVRFSALGPPSEPRG